MSLVHCKKILLEIGNFLLHLSKAVLFLFELNSCISDDPLCLDMSLGNDLVGIFVSFLNDSSSLLLCADKGVLESIFVLFIFSYAFNKNFDLLLDLFLVFLHLSYLECDLTEKIVNFFRLVAGSCLFKFFIIDILSCKHFFDHSFLNSVQNRTLSLKQFKPLNIFLYRDMYSVSLCSAVYAGENKFAVTSCGKNITAVHFFAD